MFTDVQYVIVSHTPFVYLTCLGIFVILGGTTVHANSNMQIAHTEEVCLFQEVTGVEQDSVQQIFITIKELYLKDIRTLMTNSINNTMADVITNLQEKYSQLMPNKNS